MRKFWLKAALVASLLVSSAYQGSAQSRRISDMLELPAYSRDRKEQVIFHTAYTVSFNASHKIPNWVAWELSREHAGGSHARSDNFRTDPKVRSGACPEPSDYQYSVYKYERGHMCPAADNKWSPVAMDECFYMSNMCPQKRELNAGAWNTLEDKCRIWARRWGRVYIVCGPIIEPPFQRIGPKRITAPERFFKAVLRYDAASGEYLAIAYVYNQRGRGGACSVDEVEALTGLDLFHNLPDDVERSIEAGFSESLWR